MLQAGHGITACFADGRFCRSRSGRGGLAARAVTLADKLRVSPLIIGLTIIALARPPLN